MGFLAKLKASLKKTREVLFMDVKDIFRIGRRIDEEFLRELEERLLLADAGPGLAAEAVGKVRARFKNGEIEDSREILDFLKQSLADGLAGADLARLAKNPDGPTVVIMVGVNGAGKTTSTAKLAGHLAEQGNKVILAAADTFRAAAGEQLDIWGGRLGVDVVRHPDGSDPAAVVFDACTAAIAQKADYVLADTAGRLHTQANLMRQLEKICRTAGKRIPGAPHEVLLVLDATTGQNALSQAKIFTDLVKVSGIVLAKLDGTAKGGVAIAVNRQLNLPIKFIGLGEKAGDFAPFDAGEFCEALFAGATAGKTVQSSGGEN
ncbi:MAG: signal recognition particle-docking protein FtsY [Planctomycetota bacterium]|jgi:fused signal recognition particle receptor|nr:signal recognition particle-docking protein FtsY [Planctomycetota bacterium]